MKRTKKPSKRQSRPGQLTFSILSSESVDRSATSVIKPAEGTMRANDVSFLTLMTGRQDPATIGQHS